MNEPKPPYDEIGSHVSAAGGIAKAPGRAEELESAVLQLFTKQPSRWAEPTIDTETSTAFLQQCEARRIQTTVSHDSYLINLSSPDPALWSRSQECFAGELARCAALDLDYLVTHPGNATDGDIRSGLARNADGVTQALEAETSGKTVVLLELTAGTGHSVGASFEHLAAIVDRIPASCQPRVGICFDTCHAYSAGYDLVQDYEGIWQAFDGALGLERLQLFHLTDSKHPFASRKDRHEHIGEGSLGIEPFRRILLDERFATVPKVIETPKAKGTDSTDDRRNLEVLRSLRS